jgi:type III secretion protein V
MNALARLARMANRPDLLVAAVLAMAMGMMIIPLPHVMIDIFIAFNLACGFILAMTAVYMRTATDFTSFPVVIVITTIFRLAVEITTTRNILAEGEAGYMVEAFGDFVIGGNLAVGLVIFLIITIVQLLVISKGAERVAEVAARFTLDGMPGRQMAIDADLRSGEIDQPEARRRREAMEEESQLFGAMDGAMKFVKGDTIAGLVIMVLSMVGGITIGTVQKGLPLAEAGRVYTLLSVGEAMISQIPSLLVAIAAATVVTRVKGESRRDLGQDIFTQLAGDGRALQITGVLLAAISLIPGFPMLVLLSFAALFGASGYHLQKASRRRAAAAAEQARQAAEAQAMAAAQAPAEAAAQAQQAQGDPGERPRIALAFSPALASLELLEALEPRLQALRLRLFEELGIPCPGAAMRLEQTGRVQSFSIEFEDVPVHDSHVERGCLLLTDDIANLELAGIPHTITPGKGGEQQVWIPTAHREAMEAAGLGYLEPHDHIIALLEATYRRRISTFVGIQETKALFRSFEKEYADLVEEVWRLVPVARIAEVFRRLLDDGVSLRNRRAILEGLAEWGERESSPAMIAEYIRPLLRHQICFAVAGAERTLSVVMVEPDTEELLRQNITQTAIEALLVLSDALAEELVARARAATGGGQTGGGTTVIVCSLDLRRHLRAFLLKYRVNIPVLSYQDLSEDFRVLPVGTLRLRSADEFEEALDADVLGDAMAEPA